MRFYFLVFFLICNFLSSAQIFKDFAQYAPFPTVENSSTAFADVDSDGDLDMLINGQYTWWNSLCRLYLNDGTGQYDRENYIFFPGTRYGSVEFADIDGDNDLDLLITGERYLNNTTSVISTLYTNDGMGNFTEVPNTIFRNVRYSDSAFCDVDNDGDLDVMIAGLEEDGWPVTKLYLNDGVGNFSEVPETPFLGMSSGYITFADIDNDGDKDLFLTNTNTPLYINDGQGNFTEEPNNTIIRLDLGEAAFSDIDGDNDLDLLITGSSSTEGVVTRLYQNDGAGNFSVLPNPFLVGITSSSVVFFDVDNDQDNDLLIIGSTEYGVPISPSPSTNLYINDGSGNFTENLNHSFMDMEGGAISLADTNGDNHTDILITGGNENGDPDVALYLGDGTGNFTVFPKNPLSAVTSGAVAFADIDDDGDLDIFISGYRATSTRSITKTYKNDGMGNYTEYPNDDLGGNTLGFHLFVDVDDDGDLDVLQSGYTPSESYYTKLYLNDGAGSFTRAPDNPFFEAPGGKLAVADIDGDNDYDVLITGGATYDLETRLYTNDGSGIFMQVSNAPFPNMYGGDVSFIDIDGDEDVDVLISGKQISSGSSESATLVFINDGLGNFTEMENAVVTQNDNFLFRLSDVDKDGDPDLLLSGKTPNNEFEVKLYHNDGTGQFTIIEEDFPPIAYSSQFDFTDIDGDNDDDLMIVEGESLLGNKVTKLYVNDGLGNFTEVALPELEYISGISGIFALGDIDGDMDSDLVILGDDGDVSLSQLFINQIGNNNNKVAGTCYYDLNQNQIKDPDELSLSNQKIQFEPQSTITYPIINGQYLIYGDTGSHQLIALPAENWRLTTDSIVMVNFQDQIVDDINFGFIPTTEIQLVEPNITSGPTRCSFDVPFWLSYQNNGTTFESGYLEFSLTQGVTLQETTTTPNEIIGNKLRWNYTNFPPSQLEKIRLILTMPDASNLGDTLHFTAISYLIDNNQDTIQNTVYNYNPVLNCSYDPNDKAVIPAGQGDDNLTLFDSELEYKIRFQNTGTDTAFIVRIEDDLDSELDWNTFRPISASHSYEVDMDAESGRVTFLFRNILLPDSIVNEPLSHGFVKYKISPLGNLPEGTPITNEASIFFDFNDPILTNMTLNRLVSDLTNTTETTFSTEMKVIPNPFQKTTIFRIKEIPGNRGTLNIYNTNGILVFSESILSNTDVTYRNEGLAAGIYFYEVITQKGERVFGGKVIKH